MEQSEKLSETILLNIFQLKPEYINSYGNARFHYWLKAVIDTTRFADVGSHGDSDAAWYGASGMRGVRPRFLIG